MSTESPDERKERILYGFGAYALACSLRMKSYGYAGATRLGGMDRDGWVTFSADTVNGTVKKKVRYHLGKWQISDG